MPRQKHSLSHYRLMTGDMGFLYPIGLVEALPMDTFQHSASLFMRFSPMAAPVMHPVTVRIHHFFVPMRLLWPDTDGASGWERFITGGDDGNDAQTIPTMSTTGTKGDLFDHLGVPTVTGMDVSNLPVTCYNMIYNEWFRDEDIIGKRNLLTTTIASIAWEKDYFTTARPWPQKGPAITLPLGTTAPVVGDQSVGQSGIPTFDQPIHSIAASALNTVNQSPDIVLGASASGVGPLEWDDPHLIADLTQASSVNVNDVRRAFALQRYQEARARYGSRYTEYLRYLGARPLDSRLQRPELLGSGKTRVNISEVLQTANEAVPGRFGVGDLYGHGVAHMRSNRYRRTFDEHGYVMSLLSVRPKTIYANGVQRSFLRRTKEEFWQKELQQIGQQELFEGELYSAPGLEHVTFGYQDRYQEYRGHPSNVAGDFRDLLKYWHLARDFGGAPSLNETFINCDASKRIFNVQDNDSLWCAVQHNLVARRLVSRSGESRIL